ncbi:MAG: hypothetical protein RIB58_09800 [Phycisphaerales bacterium]
MATPPGITIGRPSDTCAATGEAISPGDAIVSMLVLDDSGASLRLDVCERAWLDGWRPARGTDVFAMWRGVAPEPKQRDASRPVEDEDLVSLFEQIAEPADEQAIELRYVLAWMLIRRRRLRLEGQRDRCLRVRRVTGTGALIDETPIEVADPGLDEDQLEQAMERVAVLLLGEPEAVPVAEEAAEQAKEQA